MNPSNRCTRCGGPRDPETLRGLCPGCLVRWTRPPQLPADLADSIWVWDSGKGSRIKGYELGEELGRGGAGIVYRARQLSLDRAVAVKLLLEGPFADAAQVERFRLEAKAAAALDHPAIVPIHEVGEADGRVFYSMSLVEGPTLEKALEGFCLPAIRRDPKAAGRGLRRALRDRQREIARFLAEIARGVQHAHQHGVLHRDLKPGNILIAPGDRPMITDFGLVWVAGSKRGSGGSDSIHGTPNYIAPELTRDSGRSSVACDVYALGAIGYELVTGEPPFEAGNAVETLIRIRDGHLTPPRDLEPALSPDLEAILLRCLNPNPSCRYSSAEALAQDLERFAQGHPVEASKPGWPRRSWRWIQDHPCQSVTISAVVLTLIAMTAFSWALAARRDSERRVSELTNRRLQSELEDSTLARLQAERFSGFHSHRSNVLEDLRKIYVARPSTRIIDEAIAQLARAELPSPRKLHARIHPKAPVALTPDFRVQLEADAQGRILGTDHETGVRIWEWGDGKALPFAQLHPSPDGGHLLAVRKGRATLLAIPPRDGIAEIPLLNVVGFGPEGDWFLVLDVDRRLQRYETRTGRHLGMLSEGIHHHGNVAICPDPTQPLIAMAQAGQIRIFDWASGKVISSRSNGMQNGNIRWVGDWLVQLVNGVQIVGYNLQSGREYLLGQFSSQVMSLRPIPQHNQIAVSTDTGESGLFDLDLRTRILGFYNMEPLQFSADGTWVLVAVQDHWATVPYHSSEVLASVFPADTGRDPIRAIEFSPQGDALLVTKQAGVHLIPLGRDCEPGFLPAMGAVNAGWIPGTDEIVIQTRGSIRWHGLEPGTLRPSSTPIHVWDDPSTGWMERGALCAATPSLTVVRSDSRIEEIDLRRRKTLRVIEDPRLRGARTLDNSEDEILFDSGNGDRVRSLHGLLDRLGLRAEEPVLAFRFSPDGKGLLLGDRSTHRLVSIEGEKALWSQAAGNVIGRGNRVIAWSPDSQNVALVTGTDRVGLFRASTGDRIAQLIHSFDIHVTCMAISPGNRWMAIGLENGSLQLWDLQRLRNELGALKGRIHGQQEPGPAALGVGGRPIRRHWTRTGLNLSKSPVVVPERDARCTGAQLDLGPGRQGVSHSYLIDSADDSRHRSGFLTHAGTSFDARWILLLDSQGFRLTRETAPQVVTLPLDQPRVHSIHLLANAANAPTSVKRPVQIARLRIRYREGPPLEFPIRLGIEVEDMWSPDDAGSPTQTRVAWRGLDSSSEFSGRWLQLYHATFMNPTPERAVESIEIESSMAFSSLMVSGITVE